MLNNFFSLDGLQDGISIFTPIERNLKLYNEDRDLLSDPSMYQ